MRGRARIRRLLWAVGGSLLVLSGCVTVQRQNVPFDELLKQAGEPGKVLLFGTATGDVNSFVMETSDGRRYTVSQLGGAGHVRLFYFLDEPRDFRITRIWTESSSEPFKITPDLHVTWRGRVGEGWVNSSALYLGRVELRFRNPKVFIAVEGRVRTSLEGEDLRLLQAELAARLIDAGPLTPRGKLSPAAP